jgi:quercetin dioxygenase-like cupin family protein
MTEATMIGAGGGEVIGDSPERRVEILCEQDPLHATLSRFGPGRDGADLHVHRSHSDVFYVLEGELTVRLGVQDRQVALSAGTLALVPPLVVHGFRNASDADVRYLNFHAPGTGFAAYMRGLREGRGVAFDQHAPPQDGGRPVSDASIGGAEELAGGGRLLADTEQIAIAELSANQAEHVHARHVEAFYVLEGTLELMLLGEAVRAEQGAWVTVPAGVRHALGGEARYLDVHAPNAGFAAHLRGDGTAFDRE